MVDGREETGTSIGQSRDEGDVRMANGEAVILQLLQLVAVMMEKAKYAGLIYVFKSKNFWEI